MKVGDRVRFTKRAQDYIRSQVTKLQAAKLNNPGTVIAIKDNVLRVRRDGCRYADTGSAGFYEVVNEEQRKAVANQH